MSYLFVFLSENLWLGIRDIRYHTRRVLSLTGGTVTLITFMFVDITIIMCVIMIMCHHHHYVLSPSCIITIMVNMGWG